MAAVACSECVGFVSRASSTVRFPADLLISAWGATNSRKAAVTQGTKGIKPTRVGEKGCGGNKKAVGAATALGLGVPQQNTVLSGIQGWAGHGAAESSGLTLWIDRDGHYGKIWRL